MYSTVRCQQREQKEGRLASNSFLALWTRRGSPRPTPDFRMPTSFTALCAEHAHICRADVATDPSGVRGLHATTFVPAGEPLLAIPWTHTLTTNVSKASSHHRVAAHHLQVAKLLLDAVSDTSGFWHHWSTLLPPLAELPHPATLPRELLLELDDDALMAESQAARGYVEAAFGCREHCARSPLAEPCAACDAAHWAVALTRSRPFTLPAPTASPPQTDSVGAPQLFAFLPFIDMANHADDANCEVRGVGSRDTPDVYVAAELVALRDLHAGETLLVDYAIGQSPIAHQFADFGFVASGHALVDAARSDAAPSAFAGTTRAADDAALTRSLADDEVLLASLQSSTADDARLAAIVGYRVARKRLLVASAEPAPKGDSPDTSSVFEGRGEPAASEGPASEHAAMEPLSSGGGSTLAEGLTLAWATPLLRVQMVASTSAELGLVADAILEAWAAHKREYAIARRGAGGGVSPAAAGRSLSDAFFRAQQRDFASGGKHLLMRLDGRAGDVVREWHKEWQSLILRYVQAAAGPERARALAARRSELALFAWAGVHEHGSRHAPHHHQGSAVSGVFYLRVPPAAHADVGLFVADDPRGPRPPFDNQLRHTPTPGELLLFPPWLTHSVEPVSGARMGSAADGDTPDGACDGERCSAEPRVAISFNLGERPTLPAESQNTAGGAPRGVSCAAETQTAREAEPLELWETLADVTLTGFGV